MKRLLFLLLIVVLLLSACGTLEPIPETEPSALIPSLTWMEPEQLDAATEFTLTHSEEGYTLVTIPDDGAAYLVIPEGQPAPEDLPDTISLSCRLENGEDMIFPVKVR